MVTPKKLLRMITDPKYRFLQMDSRGFYRSVPDEVYLKRMFRIWMGEELDLENPRTFCQKLQWLKLYDRKPEYVRMADKYEAKKWAADLIGEEHITPTIGVWDRFEDIEFDALPDQFVLKCTNDSGGQVVCPDKKSLNREEAREKITAALKRNYYWEGAGREWVYKDIVPRIIAEEYIPTLGKQDSIEYKMTCFYGKVKMITVCTGIAHGDYELRKNDHFTPEWEKLPFYVNYKPSGKEISPPEELPEIIACSEKLSAGVPQLRVDGYLIDGHFRFGEVTFYTWSGLMDYQPKEWDRIMGDWLTLPEKTV